MITRIKLKNWKSHLDSEFSFSKSVNALIGIMGSGKTSVMQAIAFALFGTFSGLSSRRLGLDDLIMKKPHSKDFASVEIEFAVDGKNYVVKRTIEKGKGTTSAEIREGEKLLEVNPQGVTREVQRILQMDYDLFQRAVYSEQNALDYFLQIPKGKRMQQIDSMLKLDRYEKARESAVSIRNKIFERRKERLRIIEDLKERKFDQRISDLNIEIAGKQEEAGLLEEKVLKVEVKRRKLSEKVVSYEGDHELFNEVAKKTESLVSRVSEMERQIKSKRLKLKGMKISKEILGKLTKEIVSLEVKIEERENEVRILRERVSSKNSRILFLRDQIKESKLRLSESKEKEMGMKKLEKLLGENPEKNLGEMLDNLETAKKKLYSLEARKKEIERGLTELEGAGEKCPVCESKLTKTRKSELIEHRLVHMGEIEVKAREAEEKISKETRKIDTFRESVKKYNEIKRDLKDIVPLKEKIKENEGKIALVRKEVGKIVSEIRKKEKEEKNLRKTLEGLSVKKGRTEDLLGEKEELENLRGEKGGLEKQMKGLKTQMRILERKLKGMDIKSLRIELQEAVGLSRGMEIKLKDLEEILKDKVSILKEFEEQRDTFLKYKEEVSKYEKVIESMDIFVSVLRNTQNQLRDEFLKTVNYIMNEIWGELYPYRDFSEIRILVEKDYVLQLKGTMGWVNVDLVSGGERSLASLALRIAFSLAFTPNLRWLILDEPTHNLDANAIEHFGSVLRDRMESIIDQVFLITHEERLSDYVTGSIYKLERDKEVDGVTKILAS
ncbi:MAG: AAA family ATPase [Candidatus Aenigmarchaeota archaeon]|nr:AAA family ATPase [Candidatus Aenigmarchaeota archaeon]